MAGIRAMTDLPLHAIRDVAWALSHLRDHKLVRRAAWGAGMWLEMRPEGIYQTGLLGDIARWEPRQVDLLAHDWQPATDNAC
jgi:hypothetical protein